MERTAHIYIDESGDLGLSGNGSEYLVIAALMLIEPIKLERIVKRMRNGRFKKELKKAKEIKAHSSSRDLLKYMIEKLNEIPEVYISLVILKKTKLYSRYLRGDRNKLYNYIAGFIPDQLPIENKNLRIHIDRSKRSRALREDFDGYIINKIRQKTKGSITIEHNDSAQYAGIQFADVVANIFLKEYEYNDFELSKTLTVQISRKILFNVE
ncbi:MAG: DUF3800 domain-containing protein [Thermoplasmataceae archaeon]